jgi:hypothetical protein
MVDIPGDIIQAAQAAQAKWGVPAAVSLAQFGIESGWGTHEPPGSNNPFGIKAVAGQPSVTVKTKEYEGGRYVTIDAAFAAYPSVAGAFDAHGELLGTSHYYIAARAAVANGITNASTDAFANALTGVYATAPNYGASLIALMQSDNLYQYNLPSPQTAVQPIVVAQPAIPAPPTIPPAPIPPMAPTAPKPAITGGQGALAIGAGSILAAGTASITVHNMQIDLTPILNPLIVFAGLVLTGFASWAMTYIAAYAHRSMQSQTAQMVLGGADRAISYGTSLALNAAAQDGTINVADTARSHAEAYMIAKFPDLLKDFGIDVTTAKGQQAISDLILAKLPPYTPPSA